VTRRRACLSPSVGSAALAFAVALLILPLDARADVPSLDGNWSMTPVTETFTVQQWSPTCGPAPVSGNAQPGATVKVRLDGAELSIEGGTRTLRTDGCIDPMPTLSREAHTSDGLSWRTRCSTPASDPRRAVINAAYFLTPTGDALTIGETGRYEVTVNGSRCIADVKREGTLRKIVAAEPAPSASAAPSVTAPPVVVPVPTAAPPPPAPAPSPPRIDCSAPGNPARLEVRPSRKLLRAGDAFGFHALVLDASGCPTGTTIQWAVAALQFRDGQARADTPTIDAAGKLTMPSDLPDATFDVVATAAGRSAHASVSVTSPASYEALLAQSGLDSKGERVEPAVTVLPTGSIGASGVQAEDGAHRRRLIFISVVAGVALCLGIVAVVAARRAQKAAFEVERLAEDRHAERMDEYERHKRDREERHAAQMKAHKESVAMAQEAAAAAAARGADSGPMFCPSCRREFSSGSTYCPFDSNRLVAIAGHQNLMAGPSGGVCPLCRRGFNPGVKVCPHDGEEVVPGGAIAAAAPPVAAVRGKICPTCGGRFDGTAGFCGKDGTQLVLLN
jgi:hypothetical protein